MKFKNMSVDYQDNGSGANIRVVAPEAVVLIWNYNLRLQTNNQSFNPYFDSSYGLSKGYGRSENPWVALSATTTTLPNERSEGIDGNGSIQIPSSSIISIATQKSKEKAAGSFQIVLAGDTNWLGYITTGSWLCIMMASQLKIQGKHKKRGDRKFVKMIGRIQSVRVSHAISANGARTLTYIITGTDWGDVFNSAAFYDRDGAMNQKGVGLLLKSLRPAQNMVDTKSGLSDAALWTDETTLNEQNRSPDAEKTKKNKNQEDADNPDTIDLYISTNSNGIIYSPIDNIRALLSFYGAFSETRALFNNPKNGSIAFAEKTRGTARFLVKPRISLSIPRSLAEFLVGEEQAKGLYESVAEERRKMREKVGPSFQVDYNNLSFFIKVIGGKISNRLVFRGVRKSGADSSVEAERKPIIDPEKLIFQKTKNNPIYVHYYEKCQYVRTDEAKSSLINIFSGTQNSLRIWDQIEFASVSPVNEIFCEMDFPDTDIVTDPDEYKDDDSNEEKVVKKEESPLAPVGVTWIDKAIDLEGLRVRTVDQRNLVTQTIPVFDSSGKDTGNKIDVNTGITTGRTEQASEGVLLWTLSDNSVSPRLSKKYKEGNSTILSFNDHFTLIPRIRSRSTVEPPAVITVLIPKQEDVDRLKSTLDDIVEIRRKENPTTEDINELNALDSELRSQIIDKKLFGTGNSGRTIFSSGTYISFIESWAALGSPDFWFDLEAKPTSSIAVALAKEGKTAPFKITGTFVTTKGLKASVQKEEASRSIATEKTRSVNKNKNQKKQKPALLPRTEIDSKLPPSSGILLLGPSVNAPFSLVCRVRPFLNRPGAWVKEIDNIDEAARGEAEKMANYFKDVARVPISSDCIISIDAGNNLKDKVNFVEIIHPPIEDGTRLSLQSFDMASIERNGFLPLKLNSHTESARLSTAEAGSEKSYTKFSTALVKLNAWKYLCREWYGSGDQVLNGELLISGIDYYIPVGNNLIIRAEILDPSMNYSSGNLDLNMYFLAHIESVSHSFSVSPTGANKYNTRISFTRGIFCSENYLGNANSIYGVNQSETSELSPSQGKIAYADIYPDQFMNSSLSDLKYASVQKQEILAQEQAIFESKFSSNSVSNNDKKK
jgi:hypothetical protein